MDERRSSWERFAHQLMDQPEWPALTKRMGTNGAEILAIVKLAWYQGERWGRLTVIESFQDHLAKEAQRAQVELAEDG